MLDQIKFDNSGKIILKDIYNESNPVAYFSKLHELDYQIPQNAKPIFQKIIEARRSMTGDEAIKLIDIGCSYGVNGALLKYGLSMSQLYQMYDAKQNQSSDQLKRRDQLFYASPIDPGLEIVGFDTAEHAIDYAVSNGLLDDGFATNLEKKDPSPQEAKAVENADLIISTGCIGYVTEQSLERLLEASGDSRPWMAHFVLRMFDFESSEDMLSKHGYATEKLDKLFRQRRFVSNVEKENVLENLSAMDVDAHNAEEDGWYVAELFVARPREDVMLMPLEELLEQPVST